jgi:hypothetical protein
MAIASDTRTAFGGKPAKMLETKVLLWICSSEPSSGLPLPVAESGA